MTLKPGDAGAGLTGTTIEVGSRLELRHQSHLMSITLVDDVGHHYTPTSQHVPPAESDREFELGPFQKVFVYAIQCDDSMLVSAYTNAGKTVIADCSMSSNRKSFTQAPSRFSFCLRVGNLMNLFLFQALSNQKYHEMLAELGDVTINPWRHDDGNRDYWELPARDLILILTSCVRCYIVVQKSCVKGIRPSSTKSTSRAVLIVGWFGKR